MTIVVNDTIQCSLLWTTRSLGSYYLRHTVEVYWASGTPISGSDDVIQQIVMSGLFVSFIETTLLAINPAQNSKNISRVPSCIVAFIIWTHVDRGKADQISICLRVLSESTAWSRYIYVGSCAPFKLSLLSRTLV